MIRRFFTLVLALLFFATPVFAESSEDIQKEIEMLKKRIEELERKLAEKEKEERRTPEVLKGVEIGIGVTMIGQGNFNDDKSAEYPYDQATDGSYSFDIEVSKSFGKSGIYMHFEGGEGEGRDREIATWTGLNGDAYDTDSDIKLSELVLSISQKPFEIYVGKLDMTSYFDENEVANDETTQFLAGGFVNNPAVEFPDYGPGMVLKVQPVNWAYFTLGYESIDDEGDPEYNDLFNGGFFMAELGFSKKGFGNYRFYYWVSNRNHEDYSSIDPATGDPRIKDEDNEGFGFSFDREILKDKVKAFLRFGWQDEDLNEFEAFYSGGFEILGKLLGKDTTFGFAYSLCKISDEFEDYRRSQGSEQTEDEHHIEAYYKVSFGEHLELSLDYQFVKNPAGYDDLDDVHLLGLRTQVNF